MSRGIKSCCVLEFGLLGPLEARRDGQLVVLGGAKARALLATLVLHTGEAVSPQRLAVAVWGDDAPTGAVKGVQVHVSRLRRALGVSDALTTTPAGYILRVEPGALDVERFEALLAEARTADPARAWELLDTALALWRGTPLADVVDASFARAEIVRLEELRLSAIEARADAAMALGRHAEVIADLQALAVEYPSREELTERLMLMLYRAGRQVEALDAYQRLRSHLRDELGLDPSPRLRDVEQAILTHDRAIEAAVPSARSEPPAPPPRASFLAVEGVEIWNVPAAAAIFEGRQALLVRLHAEMASADSATITQTHVVHGLGGVGKTRLAIEFARRYGADYDVIWWCARRRRRRA
jgi:DNA-binding SARP family transcriptional activator